MELMLQERPSTQTVFNAGVSIDNLSWWFWVKAGMGFTFGAGLVSVVAVTLYWLFLVNVLFGFGRLMHR